METLTVSGTLDSLDQIASYVGQAASKAGLDKKAAYRLRLAVDEIATNIIVYGYEAMGEKGDLDIHADLDEQALTIALEDSGAYFDPLEKVPSEAETVKRPLAERQIGGLGIFLAVQGVDKFVYERVGDRNRNLFVVYRNSAN